mmetsp:Transcript_3232/g.7093  ORF Transcript_3232/g.7093 Transcript_3232/m.7093 type:complete len:688 (-) Transcript_3232:619-2682(-)|eukprot:CAMPEP_0202903164 /NCGR_PEP_ID=MMETSP1392-20130828/22108_1 /ASSEMBLY_ACC=CAM_ASM_000868 /TAXON_ID=225041 /ORGANISM="Chlamydomonas chlamydogama, Strain SAG 11-48b" /LENGTH=687 /DNA_ID=CAMNT_0049590177 /DNA_START=55 /DNA_END=2118 /DNA_ORIENTATION=-
MAFLASTKRVAPGKCAARQEVAVAGLVSAPVARPVLSSAIQGSIATSGAQLTLKPFARSLAAPQPRTVCRVAAVEAPPAPSAEKSVREDIRNIAIIAHVDHGKTTLVDALLKQSKVFRDNQAMSERIMDSNDLERERGITILAKNTAVRYKGTKINIIDTPGHADFGGEVERVLNMCDGVLLLVDSVEGPMPQTRFVLKKALQLEKKVVVVVNKIDRPAARPDWVIDNTFELFMDLGASDEQCEFPVIYASGVNGIAGLKPDQLADDLEPLFQAIVKEVKPPVVAPAAPLQMLVANIDYDTHLGRIAIGRVVNGTIRKGQAIAVCSSLEPGKARQNKVAELFVYDNFNRVGVEEVGAGDICALCGIPDIKIGETICARETPIALPTIKVEDPTVSMTFKVNTSPFAGKEGKFVTSRNLKERLERELERNLALRVEPGETADSFVVSGRGTLHLGILIENMRREGYEFEIGPPKVITREVEGRKMEPFEEAICDVPENYVGATVELFAQRKGEMVDLIPSIEGASRIKFRIATRGLLGLRNSLLTATRGMGVMNTIFLEYAPMAGEILMRDNGSLVAFETGQVTSYALESAQERGQLFVRPGDQVYDGQVVGMHAKAGDLKINVCKTKQLTNMRAASKEIKVGLDEPRNMSLDDALEYINDDEFVEVTPKSVRIRKDPAQANRRPNKK